MAATLGLHFFKLRPFPSGGYGALTLPAPSSPSVPSWLSSDAQVSSHASLKRRKIFWFRFPSTFPFRLVFFSVEMIGCKCFEWLRHFCVIKDYTTTTTSTRFVYSQTRSAAQFWIATHKNALMEADWWRRPCRTISAARSVSLSSTSAMIWITLLLCATHLTVRYHHLLF